MPTHLALPITIVTIWISAAVVLLLIGVPIFVTRAFFVKRIARYQAAIDVLEKAKSDLEGKAESWSDKKDDGRSEKGWVQQLASILLAVGGLAGLLTAATPLLHEIRDIQTTNEKLGQQKTSLDFFQKLLGFTEADWKQASEETPTNFKSGPRPKAYPYDGKLPAVIEAEDGATIKFALPKKGAILLLRSKLEAK